MYGIVDNEGKVYAKDPKFFKLNKPLALIKSAYPNKKFILTEVSKDVILVGEELKKSKLTFIKGG